MVHRGKINLRNLNQKQQDSLWDSDILGGRANLVEIVSSNDPIRPSSPEISLYSSEQDSCFPKDKNYNPSLELKKMYRGQEI